MQLFRYIFLVFFMAHTYALFAQNAWVRQTSLEGNFTIQSPQTMQEKTEVIPTDVGLMEYHRFFCQNDKEDLVFMVNYVDYPEGSLHSDSTALVHTLFEVSKEAAIANVQGTLMYADTRNLGDYPGQLWRVDYANGQRILKTWAFFVQNRFYLLQVAAPEAEGLHTDIGRFLDSFSLIAKVE